MPRIVSPGFQVQVPGWILVTVPEVRKTGKRSRVRREEGQVKSEVDESKASEASSLKLGKSQDKRRMSESHWNGNNS